MVAWIVAMTIPNNCSYSVWQSYDLRKLKGKLESMKRQVIFGPQM